MGSCLSFRNTITVIPGLLKHALDMNLEEYIHKAVGICGVSAGVVGGARVIRKSSAGYARTRTRYHF